MMFRRNAAVLLFAGLSMCAAGSGSKKPVPKTKLSIVYQSNVNGEIEPCG